MRDKITDKAQREIHTYQMPLISEDFKRVVSYPIFQLARRLKIGPKHVNSTCVTSISTKSSVVSVPGRETVNAARLSDGKGITEAAFHKGSCFSAMSAPDKSTAWKGLPGRRQSYNAYIKPVRISVTSSLPTPNKCNDDDTSTDSILCDEKDTFCVVPIPAESVKFPSKVTLPDGKKTVDTIICEDPCEPLLAQIGRVEAKITKAKARDEPPPFKTPLRAKPSIKRIMGRDMLAQETIRDNLYLFGKLDHRSSLSEVIVATEALGALYSEHSEMVDVPSDEIVAMYLGNARSSNSPKVMTADRKETLMTEGLAKPTKQAHTPLRIVVPDRSTPLKNFHWPLPPPSPVSRPTADINTHFPNPNLHLVAPFLFSLPPEPPSSTPFASLRPSPSRRPKSAIISDISFIPSSTPLPSSRRKSTPILNHNHTLHQITGFRRYRYTTECPPRTAIPSVDTVHPLDTSGNAQPSAFTFGKNAMRKARFSIANRLEKRGGRPVSGLIAFWEEWRFDAIRRGDDDWIENVRDHQGLYP